MTQRNYYCVCFVNPVDRGFFMFTGIITNLGKLEKQTDSIYTFRAAKEFVQKIEEGTSVSVNGVCLTVNAAPADELFSIEIMPETQKKTMLGDVQTGDTVNLELPVTPNTFLSGHIVQGHVDAVGEITNITREENSRLLTIRLSNNLTKYIVEKGSITVNGISLTVIEAGDDFFTIGIIPYTWDNTMIHTVKVGDKVNIEVDVLAKYLEKLINKQ